MPTGQVGGVWVWTSNQATACGRRAGGQGPCGILVTYETAGQLWRSGLGSVNGVLLVFIAVIIVVVGGGAAGWKAVEGEAREFRSGFPE
jgi:hypothetical protein